ncbi:asparagine synthase (glutamine-hydrolyzing) [Stieleria sp. TO1_6]|nr:asparagine synthase (glutamine-hydrolyzing) [Stieleria tagensis]
MIETLHHRGPDSFGSESAAGCQLAHRRLEIIDPSGGAQPMWDDTKRYCLTFNGEIYNFRELRQELQSRGVRLHTHSDTEALLLAYREYGDAVVDKLNGQFAFAIWDDQQKTLFAARDRLGEKPLYWAETPTGELLIASELKAILASGLINPQIDRGAVDGYLSLLYVPPSCTIYENVHSLAPGHALQWRSGRMKQWQYWRPALSTCQIDRPDAVREIRRLVEQAVQRQMVADTRVGAFLSGGLDSATIVGLMAQHTSSPVMTFSAGFDDLINELPYARSVAEMYGTEHNEINVDIPVAEMLQQMAAVYDEPFADSSNLPTYLISQFASQKVKVVLTGDAGDELFGGYDWYKPLLIQDSLSGNLGSQTFYRLAAKMPLFGWRKQASRRFKHLRAKQRFPDVWDRHLDFVSATSATHRQQLWQSTMPSMNEQSMRESFFPAESVSGIDRATEFDVRCYLPGDILVKVDRAAMAHGLETRSPFLDVDLVEFMLSLPVHLRFGGPGLKSLLREACGDLWPPSIRNRNKQGFGAPIAAWLQRPDVQSLLDQVLNESGLLCELLPGAVQFRNRERRQPHVVWSLLCLGLWLDRHAAAVAPLQQAA